VLNLVGKEEFTKDVINSDLSVLVDSWVPCRMPCRVMVSTLD